jgi:hypothetical protein
MNMPLLTEFVYSLAPAGYKHFAPTELTMILIH